MTFSSGGEAWKSKPLQHNRKGSRFHSCFDFVAKLRAERPRELGRSTGVLRRRVKDGLSGTVRGGCNLSAAAVPLMRDAAENNDNRACFLKMEVTRSKNAAFAADPASYTADDIGNIDVLFHQAREQSRQKRNRFMCQRLVSVSTVPQNPAPGTNEP